MQPDLIIRAILQVASTLRSKLKIEIERKFYCKETVNNANFSKLEVMLSIMTYKPNIISVSETLITPLSSGPFLNLQGYKFVHNSRLHSKGGGVAFYVKDTIRFHVLTELTAMHEKLFESPFIKLELNDESITCGTIYRSPLHDTGSNQIFLTS